jgi:succinoglycan biosynthesis transport protein ExoP
LLIFCTCLVVAFVTSPIYQSQVMIIVENQDIPEEYVKSTTTTYISERLRVLERKILSYQRLLNIIKTHTLYPDLESNNKMVEQLRKDITLETINVSLQNNRKGGSATIAFTLAYQHKNPRKGKASN